MKIIRKEGRSYRYRVPLCRYLMEIEISQQEWSVRSKLVLRDINFAFLLEYSLPCLRSIDGLSQLPTELSEESAQGADRSRGVGIW